MDVKALANSVGQTKVFMVSDYCPSTHGFLALDGSLKVEFETPSSSWGAAEVMGGGAGGQAGIRKGHLDGIIGIRGWLL